MTDLYDIKAENENILIEDIEQNNSPKDLQKYRDNFDKEIYFYRIYNAVSLFLHINQSFLSYGL